MKKVALSITTLVISITISLLFVCSAVANAQRSKSFVYEKNKDSETVFLLNSTSWTFTPYLKYEDKNISTCIFFQSNEMQDKWEVKDNILFEYNFALSADNQTN